MKQCCSCRLCLQTIFLISFRRNGGTEDKKKEMKGKTIFLDPVVCLVGLGAQHDLGPKLLITRD